MKVTRLWCKLPPFVSKMRRKGDESEVKVMERKKIEKRSFDDSDVICEGDHTNYLQMQRK